MKNEMTEYSLYVQSVSGEVLENTIAQGGGGSGHNMRSLAEVNVLRILPPKVGERLLFYRTMRHFIPAVDQSMRTKVVLCPGASKCPVCRVVSVAELLNIVDATRSAARAGAYWVAVDVKDDPRMEMPDTKAGVYWFPWTVHSDIADKTGLTSRELVDEPWHPINGYPLKITRKGNAYSVIPLKRQVSPVPISILKDMPPLVDTVTQATSFDLGKAALQLAIKYGIPADKTPFLDWGEAEVQVQPAPSHGRLPNHAPHPQGFGGRPSGFSHEPAPRGRSLDSRHDMSDTDIDNLTW